MIAKRGSEIGGGDHSRRKRWCWALLLALAINSLWAAAATHLADANADFGPPATHAGNRPAGSANAKAHLLRLPLRFEPEAQQPARAAGFVAHGTGYAVRISPAGVCLGLKANPGAAGTRVQLNLVGANAAARLTPGAELPGKAHHFRGNDPSNWRRNVPTFAQVRCEQVYPGIDVVYYGTSQKQLEYDFLIAPEADPSQIQIDLAGADHVELGPQGDLLLHTAHGQVRLRKPLVYQMIDGHRHDVAGAYQLRFAPDPQSSILNPHPQISFQIAAYNLSVPLIIDPILDYATYLGGTGHDSARAIAVDPAGNAYIAGVTASTDFPTANPKDSSLNDNDAFVVKLNADGTGIVYATYFGGSSSDSASGIAIDAGGNAYITGNTWSASDFPLVNPIQPNHKFGGTDAFVAKLNSEGNAIVYSTFLGGTGTDAARGIAVDAIGQAGVTGVTSSTDFPTTANSIQGTLAGAFDVFVAKLSADGSIMMYSSYLGGSGDEFSYELPRIAMDPAGHAFVTGVSGSTDFPTTTGALQTHFGGGINDLFVSKFAPDGKSLVYSTHLGGTDWDAGSGSIALDAEGCAYVVTSSASSDFPLVPAPLSHTPNYPELLTRHGLVCVVKISPDGSSLRYAARLPGSYYPGGLAVDVGGHAWVVGDFPPPTVGWEFPSVNPIQATHGGGDSDAILLKLSPDADTLLFAGFLGGSGSDSARAVATGPGGLVYVVGETTSENFPTVDALQPEFAGTADAFVLRLDNTDTAPPTILAAGNYGEINTVTLSISEALDPVSATNTANYALNQGVTITAAEFGVNSRTLRLITSGLNPGTTYTLSVSHVLDRAPAPNAIATDTTVTFTAMNFYRGFLRQENYSGIETAGDLEALTSHAKFPNHPDTATTLHEFEIVANAYYQDGLRLSGWLLPPVTGDYTFYLCNISQAALYLSRDATPHNKLRIAFEPCGFGCGGSGSRAWNHLVPGWNGDLPPHTSLPIHLEAGRAYYLEALATSSAGNVLGVAWQMPGQPPPRNGDPPIPGACLALLGNPTAATVTIIEQPTSVTISEGQSAAFSLKAVASEPKLFYQWRKNGLDIPGANTSSLFLPELSLGDDGSAFECVVTIPGTGVTSQTATLGVTPDTAPPALLSAEGNVSNEHLTLTFSEPIRPEDATNTANYSLGGGLVVSSAVLLADRKTVVLTTSSQTPGASYTAAVSGIRDRSTAANPVDADTVALFFGWVDEEFVGPFSGWANVKEVYGAVGDGVADDTDAIQQALDDVATPGHAAIIYFPAGTYRITRTLNFVARLSASLIGEDPTTTIIKWDGPTDGTMLFANGVAMSRWSRLTWDGSATAEIAVHHGNTGIGYHVTGNQHSDEIFCDVGAGLLVDPVNGGDTHLILRCHFLRCWIQGIAVSSYNAIDWHIWDSVFEDCRYGLRSYVGNFHVYRSLFLHSTEMDIFSGTGYTGIRGNTSIGSKAFTDHYINYRAVIQGNTIVDALDPTPIRWPSGGSVILLDNTIVSRANAPDEPAVRVGDNLTSVGNTFTVTHPIAVGGRSVQMEDRVVSRDEVGLPPAMVPRFLPRSTSPVIEVPAGANAVTIQQAIDAAVALNGQRPVVHLPAGRYELDRTLIIPPNTDLQLVGDGFANHATTLVGPNIPGVPIIFLAGPSRATLRDFHVLGTGAGWQRALASGIVIENCDQPDARVFLEQVWVNFSLTNSLVVNRLDHADVSAHDFVHGAARGVSLRVIGGADQAAGQRTTGRVAMFGGATGGGNLTYQVEGHGRLMVQDAWFEAGPGFMRLADSGTLTLNNVQIAPGDEDHTHGGPNGAIELNDFHGRVSLLNASVQQTTALVKGDGSDTELLLLGNLGYPDAAVPPLATYVDKQSPNARVEHWFSESNGRQLPHTTEPDPVFLRKMLEQVRTEKPRRLVPLPEGVTDVRIYRVSTESCKYGMILSGSNALPELPALPTQYGDEESLLLVANIVTGPDAPYGLYAFTMGPGTPTGMTLDPDSGVIRWTPAEAQGPSTNEIQVIVTAHSSPLLKATNVVTIVIRETNQSPELQADREFVGTDIGRPPYPGWTVTNPDGSIEVQASGAGTHIPGDDFHFSHQQVTGDFDIGVEIASMEGGTTGTGAGLMARVSLDAESPFIQFTMNPPGGYAWWPAYRVDLGALPTLWHGSAGGGSRYPTWLRLQRQGPVFRALVKYEDTDWNQVDELTLPTPFPDRLYLGLCTWSWAAGQDPGIPPPQTRVLYRDYRNYPAQPSHVITDRTVNEGEQVLFQALARDPDVPSALTFSLDPAAPDGASIDPVSGLFTWTPSEAQGPGVYPITVRVTDNGEPPLSDAKTFTVTVLEPPGYEADVAPRPNGSLDGKVTVTDWVQVGRFVAGLDTPDPGSEFQRADCALRETLGNGALTVSDWVQAGRYAAGLDPVVGAGGPRSAELTPTSASASMPIALAKQAERQRAVEVRSLADTGGSAIRMAVRLQANGDENALGFSLGFDAAAFRYRGSQLGTAARQAQWFVNTSAVESGRIGFVLALPAGQTFEVGPLDLVEVQFEPVNAPGSPNAARFFNDPIRCEVVSVDASELRANWIGIAVPDGPDDAGHPGETAVGPVVSVKASLVGGVLTISWPTGETDHVLESSPSIGPGATWTPVPNLPRVVGGCHSVILEASTTTRFYRLRGQ